MKRWVRPGIVTAAAVAAVMVGGCGGDDVSSELSPDAVADAATKTARTGSYKIAFKGEVRGPGLPQDLPFTGEGEADSKRHVGKVSLDFSDAAGGQGADPEDLQIEEVFQGLVIYMRSPLFEKGLKGKGWLRLDLQEAGKSAGIDLGELGGVGQSDPSQSLDYLRAVTGKLENEGKEEVRGIPTTHYRATVDLRRYPDLVPKAKRRQAAAGAKRLIKLSGTSKFPTDVWVDQKGLVRRQTSTYAFKTPDGGRLRTRQELEFHDFGTQVDVDIPPREDTLDATKLAARELRKQSAP